MLSFTIVQSAGWTSKVVHVTAPLPYSANRDIMLAASSFGKMGTTKAFIFCLCVGKSNAGFYNASPKYECSQRDAIASNFLSI